MSDLSDDEYELELCKLAGELWGRPYEFVMAAWPWGEEGGPLAKETGPDTWQRQLLLDLGEEIRERNFDGSTAVLPIKMAVGSGHGIGKSTLVAWLILFLMITRPYARGVVTATTGPQLESKTIPELAKWLAWCRYSHWFELRASIPGRLAHVDYPVTWRCDFQTSKKENSDAFQGLHAVTSTPFYIFDESSGIDDKIWEVSEGGLTDGEPMMFAFGNRTRITGMFNACFRKRRDNRWLHYTVDSREAKKTNKALLAQWIADWGIDSDFIRVRVLGLAPKEASEQLISETSIDKAKVRPAVATIGEPLLMGIDVARFGEDRSAFAWRKGRDARTHPIEVFRGIDLMTLSEKASERINELRPDTVFIDGGGMGAGVVDRLRQLGHDNIIEINFGGGSPSRECYDRRSYMWWELAKWLRDVGAIPSDDDLREDLVAQEYCMDRRTRSIRLVSKEDLRTLGLPSPDLGDALALTFAMQVAPITAAAGGAAGGLAAATERRKRQWHPTDRIG